MASPYVTAYLIFVTPKLRAKGTVPQVRSEGNDYRESLNTSELNATHVVVCSVV